MWECKKCAERHEDVFDSCWKCGTPCEKDPPHKTKNDNSQKENRHSFLLPCTRCGSQLRITLPMTEGRYTCPMCKTQYQSVKTSGSPLVFVLVPEPNKKTTEETPPPPKRPRVMPNEVRLAMMVFGLTENNTLEEARTAYRNAVQQYHPDKVAHLGPELKRLAEQKTKEFVIAFDQIKKFFAKTGE